MASVPRPDIDCDKLHPELPVSDVSAAVDFYTNKLGFLEVFMFGDPPTMAGVNLGEVQVFLEQGTPNPQGCGIYFVVSDADALYEYHRAGGVEILVPIDDRQYGLRDYRIRDLYGYHLNFGHHLLSESAERK